ncbi:MAG: phosphopantetheine-binding protein [Coriobacteriia bacterium]|nr:phosphopantetheine-binding protein [Coriobacteriia bacterium]
MDTLTVIKEILKDKQNIEPDKVDENSTFQSLNLDSLDVVEMVCELEEKLDIDFGDPEGLQTVGDVVKYIDSIK